MSEPWPFDNITNELIDAYVRVIKVSSGWGLHVDNSKAVYPGLLLPFPQEPFPCAYVYLAGMTNDEGQGTGLRVDLYQISVRILGGPLTPGFRVNPERSAQSMLTPVLNELTYRRHLQDPTSNNDPFRYIAAGSKVTILPGQKRSQAFHYPEQGSYVGVEVPTSIGLELLVGRLS